ncbi:hypothetical protein ABZ354_27215, partial [Streptomyces sp. NPDC005925]
MPYLSSTLTGAASTGIRLGVGVPGHGHPRLATAEWPLPTRPGTPLDRVVLDVADGPGAQPDPQCLATAGRPRTRPGGAAWFAVHHSL